MGTKTSQHKNEKLAFLSTENIAKRASLVSIVKSEKPSPRKTPIMAKDDTPRVFHKKPRGRPPKNKEWDAFTGRYVPANHPNIPPPSSVSRSSFSSSSTSSLHSWNSDEMNDTVFQIGRKQNPYRECTRKQRDVSGQYMEGYYYARKNRLRRSMSEQGARMFTRGLEEPPRLKKTISDQALQMVVWNDNRDLPYPIYFDVPSPQSRYAEAERTTNTNAFVTEFACDIETWYNTKSDSEKHFLDTSKDCRSLTKLMINALDNYLALNGY